jgi:hypothetical protein
MLFFALQGISPAYGIIIMKLATALLLSYERQDNLRKIIDNLRKQSVDIDIFLWNNNPEDKTEYPVELQINSSKNLMCWPRWFMANYASTDYVFSLDDDLLMMDNRLIEQCIDYLSTHDCDAIGYSGVKIHDPKKPYKDQLHINSVIHDAEVDVLKGGFIFVNKNNINLPSTLLQSSVANPRIEDDIIVSSLMGKKVVPAMLRKRFTMLSGFQNGLHSHPDHYESRNEYISLYHE